MSIISYEDFSQDCILFNSIITLYSETGKLMARYCIAFETMKHFLNVNREHEGIADMVRLLLILIH